MRRHQRADQQREEQHTGVAARAGHAGHRRDLVALEQVRRHRDDRDRQRLVREAGEAEERDRHVRDSARSRRTRRRSSGSAPTVNAPRRALIRLHAEALLQRQADRPAEHAAEIGRQERQPREQRDLLQIECRTVVRYSGSQNVSVPHVGSARKRGSAMPQKFRCLRISPIDGRVPSACR